MTVHTLAMPAPVRLLDWFGLRRGADRHRDAVPAGEDPAIALAIQDAARRLLLDMIGAFLLDHHLDVSGANLVTAHGAISGIDHKLAKVIDARLKSQLGITQEWLDEVTGGDAYASYRAELEGLMGRLDTELHAFATSTRAAHVATGDYRTALEQHVATLSQAEGSEGAIAGLADLAAAMLERTRRIEDDMRRTELEARSLRQSLAEARRNADIDHLTGLPNRRAFEALLASQHAEAMAAGDALTVAFCDIDHFKLVNDTHGHDTGDRVIKVIAEALSHISNEHCYVARHGGEEFVILFRGRTPQDVWTVLDETREALSRRRMVNRVTDMPLGLVTFSGGIADVFAHPEPRAALKAADAALYRAKAEGRNRILIADREAA